MGAWGEEPKDNDGAWNLLVLLEKPVDEALEKLYRKTPRYTDDRWERAGFVQLVLERASQPRLDICRAAIDDINFCLLDREWVKGWRSPRKLRDSASRIRDAMQKLVTHEEARIILQSRGRKKRAKRHRRYAPRVMPWIGWPKPAKLCGLSGMFATAPAGKRRRKKR